MVEVAGSRRLGFAIGGAIVLLLAASASVGMGAWLAWLVAGDAAPKHARLLDLGKWLFVGIALYLSAIVGLCLRKRSSLHVDPASLIAPATLGCHEMQACVNVSTAEGPIRIIDHYEQPLPEIRRRVNAAFDRAAVSGSSLPTCGDGGMDAWLAARLSGSSWHLRTYGARWHVSMGWHMMIAVAALVIFAYSRDTAFMSALAFPFFAVLSAAMIHAEPSHRYPRWALFTPEYVVFVNDGVWVIPTTAVVDASPSARGLAVRCRNGGTVTFPDASLETLVADRCGLRR